MADTLRTALAAPPLSASLGEVVGWQRRHGPERPWLSMNDDDVDFYRSQGQEVRPLYAGAILKGRP